MKVNKAKNCNKEGNCDDEADNKNMEEEAKNDKDHKEELKSIKKILLEGRDNPDGRGGS